MVNIGKELANLQRLGPKELRAKHLEVFGEETRTGNKPYLVKRIAWRLQMRAEGDLSERAKRRAAELADDADIRMTVPRPPPVQLRPGQKVISGPIKVLLGSQVPMPGTVLTREYRGRTIRATVLERGFDHEGTVYKSLTAIAKVVTGSHWNGHLFFGLRGGKR